ncbi:MAG: hypothetical protein KDE27_32800, partial [Planctomycetes bacterium]|nr:hypothetical protein [Planctomycetota bacterium]
MKQNERILVYLVTGFLAVILVVAVFFGRDGGRGAKPDAEKGVRGLGQILNQQPADGAAATGSDSESGTVPGATPGATPGNGGHGVGNTVAGFPNGTSDGGDPAARAGGAGSSPLVASVPVPPAERIQDLLGDSRRDRTVRIVRARAGDSLESLVRRWCGARDPFLDEARALNEELTILRLGQEVVVPWVDDEQVVAAYEARQPRLLAGGGADDGSVPVGGSPNANGPNANGPNGSTAPTSTMSTPAPSFRVPNGEASPTPATAVAERPAA